ncbi:MAG: iron ABC transporter permease [Clostridia bacterium]|nr:iron ABC transporter permease [Clostridia bacterium]
MNRRTILVGIGACIVVAAGLLAAACLGAKSISIQTVWDSIFHYEQDLDMMLVRDSRLPRAICSVLVGGLLAMAGAMMQGITRNDIAEPSVMGVTQGAVLAVAIASVSASVYGVLGNTLAALIGALISGTLVLLFSMQSASNMSTARLLLAGTAISTFFLSMASLVALLGNRSQDLAFWVSGGFRTATWKYVYLLAAAWLICAPLSIRMAHKINIVSLGDDVAIGLGVNPTRVRIHTVAVIIPMCAVCVATAGNIAFVGLIVPHIARKLLGNDYRRLIPISMLCGSALLAWADVAAKMANIPYETPIGLFSALLGIPIFIALVRREKG